LDSNREYLRTNITNSLVDNLLFNERRQKDSIKLFEISDVYSSNNGINKRRKLSIVASGRVGLNFEDFSKKINKKYLSRLFQEILPNEVFDFEILSRDLLDTKIKNEIVTLEVDIDKFSSDILSYNEVSKSPEGFVQFNPISEFPSSYRDISFLITDPSKIRELEQFISHLDNEILKETFIFDFYENKDTNKIKIGFRFIFQSDTKTLTLENIDKVMNVIIADSLSIDSIQIPGLK